MALAPLQRAAEVLAPLTGAQFTHDSLEQALRSARRHRWASRPARCFSRSAWPICGRKNAPPLFATLEVLGRDTSLARIDQAIQKLQ